MEFFRKRKVAVCLTVLMVLAALLIGIQNQALQPPYQTGYVTAMPETFVNLIGSVVGLVFFTAAVVILVVALVLVKIMRRWKEARGSGPLYADPASQREDGAGQRTSTSSFRAARREAEENR